jgi:hypothetical protein
MRLASVRRRLVLPLLAAIALPLSLGAQETQLFNWTGRVDREVTLTMRARNVATNASRGDEYRGRFDSVNELPRMDGTLRVEVSGGRAEASVIQQPSASNNYQAVIRVVDRGNWTGRPQVTAFFTPSSTAGNSGGTWNRGNGNNNSDDDRYNNGRGRGRNAAAVMHWSGNVDANAEIRWQGTNVRQRSLDGAALRGVRSSVDGNVNTGRGRRDGLAVIAMREGRGQVTIVQQPMRENNYPTIIRVNDPQGGYGRYTFDVTVQ